MGLLDKVKAGAEQAATRAKEGVQDVQTKRELSQVYHDLGERTFELVDKGELHHPELDELAAKVRELQAQLEEEPAPAGEAVGTEPPDEGPPAMPV